MKPGCMTVCAFACSMCFALPCLSQGNQFNGSWKVDPSTVKFDGPTYSVMTDADGYTVTRGGQAQAKVVCDGKPHEHPDKSVVTCHTTGSEHLVDVTENGKRTNRITISPSADGKTVTRKNTIYPQDGSSPYTVTMVSRKVSGGGANVTWKDISFNESQDKGVLSIHVNGDTVAFKETDNDKPVMLKLDGTPVKFMSGTMAAKMDNPHTLVINYTGSDGKMRRHNTFELSADGKTLTETDVTPAPSQSTMSMKFHKM